MTNHREKISEESQFNIINREFILIFLFTEQAELT